MSSDLSSAGNPLPSDRTPEALSPATAAVYRRYRDLLADTARQAALAAWVEDCRELQAAGDPKVGISLFFAEAEKGMLLNPLYGAHLILENWQILSQDRTYDVLLQSLAMASEALSGHPETLRDASRAAYYAASTALENLQDEEAAFLWAHRALKLSKLAGEALPLDRRLLAPDRIHRPRQKHGRGLRGLEDRPRSPGQDCPRLPRRQLPPRRSASSCSARRPRLSASSPRNSAATTRSPGIRSWRGR